MFSIKWEWPQPAGLVVTRGEASGNLPLSEGGIRGERARGTYIVRERFFFFFWEGMRDVGSIDDGPLTLLDESIVLSFCRKNLQSRHLPSHGDLFFWVPG